MTPPGPVDYRWRSPFESVLRRNAIEREVAQWRMRHSIGVSTFTPLSSLRRPTGIRLQSRRRPAVAGAQGTGHSSTGLQSSRNQAITGAQSRPLAGVSLPSNRAQAVGSVQVRVGLPVDMSAAQRAAPMVHGEWPSEMPHEHRHDHRLQRQRVQLGEDSEAEATAAREQEAASEGMHQLKPPFCFV